MFLGVSACNEKAKNGRYFIAVSSSAPAGEFEEYIVPAATWAVFSGRGTGISIQELERRNITDWLLTSGYEYSNSPDIEVYFDANPEDMEYQVWVPVGRK